MMITLLKKEIIVVKKIMTIEEKRYSTVCSNYLKAFGGILNQIGEGIDSLNSCERTMQVKRSIDKFIETLYNQAASKDIGAECETVKHARDKSEFIKRVIEKWKKQVMEEVLNGVFARRQKELINTKHLNSGHEAASNGGVHEAKKRMKREGIVFSYCS
ncbi:hypothetical protein [Wolbachia endosymbiont of Litomosoides brasiliensis]|uniref:hypothetical protein n=1 Tax=Wolbachia endosymbiont of Litomosoides brasiliensis TaxID=1812117 RepID=UPI001FE535FF|nr:hypothetical protein [Wolbachia endosymbiont of Litomosoides brasiliensis]